jgi:hypothetical protein
VKQPQLSEKPSEEFLVKVNDFIEMANRIERRHDSAHAQMPLHYAFSRYGAYHYFNTVKADTPEEREAYVGYIGGAVVHLVRENFAQMTALSDSLGDAADE